MTDISMQEKHDRNLKHIGKVINIKRIQKQMTQDRLAEELGVSKSTVSRYENARMEIPAADLEIISDICEFNPVEYFLGYKSPADTIGKIANNLGYLNPKKKRPLTTDISITPYCYMELSHIEWLSRKIKENAISMKTEAVDYMVNGILIENIKRSEDSKVAERLYKYWNQLKRE